MSHWHQGKRNIAAVLWPSFLAACLAMLLFFGKLDVGALSQAFVFDIQLSELGIYSIGFLFFWGVTTVSSALSTWLIRTERRVAEFPIISQDDDPAENSDGQR